MKKAKGLLRLFMCVLFSFVCIYLFVFTYGWKLIESGDIILIEIAVSIVVGAIVFAICENWRAYEFKIRNLQEHIEKLEEKIDKLNDVKKL